jgi:UDP-N-acetylglucosamine:LPS N-acetylglucosamine transferase
MPIRKILFIPSDHGGGRGHVSRCLYLAKQLRSSGFQNAIVLEKKHFAEGQGAGLETFLFETKWERLKRYQRKKPHKPMLRLKNTPPGAPVFTAFSGLSYQVPRDGYISEKIAAYRMKQFDKIVQMYKPDLLIGDTHFLTFLIGKKHQVPVLQITRQAGFPPKPEFFWWSKQMGAFLEPNATGPFQELCAGLEVSDIERAEDLLRGDHYLIPSSKDIEPVKRRGLPVSFCGPLTEISQLNRPINYFLEQSEYPKIYITIGGGAGRSQEKQFFNRILQIFDKTDYRVMISTAGTMPAKEYNGLSSNVLFVDWIDGLSAIKQSDLVIHHGGYGTTMETLVAEKPSVIIPSHSEQEGNGRRLEKLGVGKVVLPYEDELQAMDFSWPYGDFSMYAAYQIQLNSQKILEAVESLLYKEAIYNRLKAIGSTIKQLQEKMDFPKLVNSF